MFTGQRTVGPGVRRRRTHGDTTVHKSGTMRPCSKAVARTGPPHESPFTSSVGGHDMSCEQTWVKCTQRVSGPGFQEACVVDVSWWDKRVGQPSRVSRYDGVTGGQCARQHRLRGRVQMARASGLGARPRLARFLHALFWSEDHSSLHAHTVTFD